MRFLHATSSRDGLLGILRHGLIINPCERGIIDAFTSRTELLQPEPQPFGMVCLHNFNLVPNVRYWRKFGPFGVELAPKWVDQAGFSKVLYLDTNGPEFLEHKRFFKQAVADADRAVQAQHPEDTFRKQAYISKNVALILGAHLWADFLTQYAYFEAYKHRYQREWRFVREVPFRRTETFTEVLQSLETDAGWSRLIYTLPIPRAAVIRLIAPNASIPLLRKELPPNYRDVPIVRPGFPVAFAMRPKNASCDFSDEPPVRDGFGTPRWRRSL